MAHLKGRDVIILASTWPDMTPPLAAGWPGKVTEYLTGVAKAVVGDNEDGESWLMWTSRNRIVRLRF